MKIIGTTTTTTTIIIIITTTTTTTTTTITNVKCLVIYVYRSICLIMITLIVLL